MSAAKIEPRYLTREQAALAANVSVDLIKRAINTGRLRAKRSGQNAKGEPAGKYLISIEALDAWFKGLKDA